MALHQNLNGPLVKRSAALFFSAQSLPAIILGSSIHKKFTLA
jgi:hypothetical protein